MDLLPLAESGGALPTNAGNYATGWTNGANGGTGFAPWVIKCPQAGTGFAGNLIGDPNAAGIGGMGNQAFGLFANPVGSGAFVDAQRDFAAPLPDGGDFQFPVGRELWTAVVAPRASTFLPAPIRW